MPSKPRAFVPPADTIRLQHGVLRGSDGAVDYYHCEYCGWLAGSPEEQRGGDWNATESHAQPITYFCKRCGAHIGSVS